MKKSQYKIGDWVVVATEVEFIHTTDSLGDKRSARRVPYSTPFVAQIVGAKYNKLGKYHPDCSDGPRYFECTGTQLTYLVRRGMTSRPINVLPDDLTLLHWRQAVKQDSLPWRWVNPIKWTKDDRLDMSQLVNDQPRDSSGRFTKQTKGN